MYEMEEGIGDDESLMSGSSIDLGEDDYIYNPVSFTTAIFIRSFSILMCGFVHILAFETVMA